MTIIVNDYPRAFLGLKDQQQKNGFHVATKSKAGVMIESQPMSVMTTKVEVEANDDRRYLS